MNAGLLLVEPNKKEYDDMIKELQQPIEKWMGKNKYHKGFYTFNFDTPKGNKFKNALYELTTLPPLAICVPHKARQKNADLIFIK